MPGFVMSARAFVVSGPIDGSQNKAEKTEHKYDPVLRSCIPALQFSFWGT